MQGISTDTVRFTAPCQRRGRLDWLVQVELPKFSRLQSTPFFGSDPERLHTCSMRPCQNLKELCVCVFAGNRRKFGQMASFGLVGPPGTPCFERKKRKRGKKRRSCWSRQGRIEHVVYNLRHFLLMTLFEGFALVILDIDRSRSVFRKLT